MLVVPEARHGQFTGHHAAAEPGVALEHDDLPAGDGQVGRSHQAVVAGADRDDIERFRHSSPWHARLASRQVSSGDRRRHLHPKGGFSARQRMICFHATRRRDPCQMTRTKKV